MFIQLDDAVLLPSHIFAGDSPPTQMVRGLEYTFDTPGRHTVHGVALDEGGNESRLTRTVRVLDPQDTQPPTVAVNSPASGALVGAPTHIVGTVNDANLAYWELATAPADTAEYTTLATGHTPIVDDVLGEIVPAEYAEGEYLLRLEAEDVNGRRRTLTGSFAVPICDMEICDGLDNDCDGEIDETFILGDPCTRGVGHCQTAGTTACAPDGHGTICDAPAPVLEPELCDGVDNDCDGTIDEGFFVGDICTVGRGICARPGVVGCTVDGGSMCTGETGDPAEEICDGLDNDCDGQFDEGTPGAGAACSAGIGACHAVGIIACDGAGGALVCNAVPGDPAPELCDGQDNDCDGDVDEDFPLGEPCSTGEGACAADGVIACALDATLLCDTLAPAAEPETCDGEDNDCDGQIDEWCNDETAPAVSIQMSVDTTNPGETVTIAVLAADESELASVQLSINDQRYTLDEHGQATFTPPAPGLYRVIAVAVDGAGNRTESAQILTARDPDDHSPPVVAITSPLRDADLTEPTAIRGTVDDPNLTEYRLEYAEVNETEWIGFARNDQPVTDGVLGVFDAGLLPNGIYRVRVVAEDVNGLIADDIVMVNVGGLNKVGVFTITYTDLTISVAGVSMAVRRTYDSRDKYKRDFGVGWHLSLGAGRYQMNRPLSEAWQIHRSKWFGDVWSAQSGPSLR